MRIGNTSSSRNGSSPSQRPDTLDDIVFTRSVNDVVDAGVEPETIPVSSPVDNESNLAPGCVAAGSANQTVSVLLVGNSLMNNVQSDLEQLLVCGGYTPELATSNPGGYWLHQHNELSRTTELIAEGYDLTLLQEQSRSINTHMPPYDILNALKAKIEAAGSVMGFYQTWGCLLYTSPSPRDRTRSRMPSSA